MAEEEGTRQGHSEEKDVRWHERVEDGHRTARGGLIFGLVLVSVGVILLIDNLYPGFGFSRLWPVIIIAWGFSVLISGLIGPFDISKPLRGILIGTVGAILLCNTLGIIPYRFWLDLIVFWPVLIIALGLSVLAGVTRSRIAAALPTLLIIATLIFAVFYGDGVLRPRLEPTVVTKTQAAIPGVSKGVVMVDFSVGELNIGATEMLYDLRASEFGDERGPDIDFSESKGEVEVGLKARDNVRFLRRDERRKWDVLLSKDLDWRLNLKTGVSDNDLDLSELKVSSVEIDGGVGSIRARFGDRNRRVDAKIKTGVSEVKLFIPRSSGVRVSINRGLSATSFRGIDLEKVSENGRTVYETPGFKNAANKIDLDVEVGVSSFTVEAY